MTSLNDIGDPLAREMYAAGENPMFYAEIAVTKCIEVHQAVTFHRAVDPGAFPGYPPALGNEALASRVVGLLLDLGWTDPRSGGDMDGLAQFAFSRGTMPLRHAENTLTTLLEAHALVCAARAEHPEAIAAYGGDLSYGALAAGILRRLTAAGWTPPDFTTAERSECPGVSR